MFLCYASEKGAAFIERALYFSARVGFGRGSEGGGWGSWEGTVRHQRRVSEGHAQGSFRGRSPSAIDRGRDGLRHGTGSAGLARRKGALICAVAVPANRGIHYEGHQRQVQKVAQGLAEEAWFQASAGEGSKGDRLYNWACVELPAPEVSSTRPSSGRWLLVCAARSRRRRS